MNIYHYVYRIIEKDSGKKYIGSRSSKIHPSEDIGIMYFSSSRDKDFIKNQKEFPKNYKYEILSIHEERESALIEEARLHDIYDVGRNIEYINKAKQTVSTFDVSGTVVVKDEYGNILSVSVDDPNYKNGKYKFILCGTVKVKDKHGNNLTVSIDDEKYLSGEYVGLNKGKRWINNGEINRLIHMSENLPDGWYKGKLNKLKSDKK